LTREDNAVTGTTTVYEYDAGGNRASYKTYAYTTGTPGAQTGGFTFTYGDATWGDLLTSINGIAVTYDAMGNPLSYNGNTYTWTQGRELASIALASGSTVSFTYNDQGQRTSKTVDGVTTNYYLDASGNIVCSKNPTDTLWFYYDANNKPIGFEWNGTPYYYTFDLQGDVTAILDKTGAVVVQYGYDAYGRVLSMTGTLVTSVGAMNPFRYRRYYYDTQTGLYYLQSRYYNPQWGRFINADDTNELSVEDSLPGNDNLFAYCYNNPVTYVDYDGSYATVRYGSTGVYVETLQAILNLLGYKGANGKNLATDGIFGNNTSYATKKFQRAKGLVVDGIVGPKTWAALRKVYIPTPIIAKNLAYIKGDGVTTISNVYSWPSPFFLIYLSHSVLNVISEVTGGGTIGTSVLVKALEMAGIKIGSKFIPIIGAVLTAVGGASWLLGHFDNGKGVVIETFVILPLSVWAQ